MTENSLSIIQLATAAIGIVVLATHLFLQRKLYSERMALEKEKYESDKKARETQFKDEQDEREARKLFFQRETLRLTDASELLGDTIALRLRRNIDWAAEALDRAKLSPKNNALFAGRMSHFREEKIALAEKFAHFILLRAKAHVIAGKKVVLAVDSGSTLAPFLEELGRGLVQMYENGEQETLKSISLATNNLPGIEGLMNSGRVNLNNPYSNLAIQTYLLPGTPVPVFEAVTGKETEKAVTELRRKLYPNESQIVQIGVVTGNWVRLRRRPPVCPVPLARGPGHLAFKEQLINSSDEVFVVAPLGKIFAKVGPDEVNPALHLSNSNTDPGLQPYDEAKISEETAQKIRLVSTSRGSNRVLTQHSQQVKTCLTFVSGQVVESDARYLVTVNLPIADVPHFMFPFDGLPSNRDLQIESEFPHTYTRREEFMGEFFGVARNIGTVNSN